MTDRDIAAADAYVARADGPAVRDAFLAGWHAAMVARDTEPLCDRCGLDESLCSCPDADPLENLAAELESMRVHADYANTGGDVYNVLIPLEDGGHVGVDEHSCDDALGLCFYDADGQWDETDAVPVEDARDVLAEIAERGRETVEPSYCKRCGCRMEHGEDYCRC